MNPDKKELFETAAVVFLILAFMACCMLCVVWGVAYQVLVLFAGFLGTLIGAFTNKMRAGGNAQPTTKTTDTVPPVPPAPSS